MADLIVTGVPAVIGARTTATPVAVVVTATPDPGYTPPRIRLDVVDTRPSPAASLTITRRNPDGSTHPVRTSDGGPLTLSSGRATIYDSEPPYDSPLVFTTDQAGGPTVATEMDGVDDVWLIHPGVPSLSQKIKVTSLPQRTRATSRGLHKVLGREDPVPISSGARESAAGTMGVRTYTDGQRQALELLCDDDAVLLLNIPASKPWGWNPCYVSVGDLVEARTTRHGRFPYREWQLPIQVVGRPGGGTQSAVTWTSVAARYATWQAIKDAGITSWADLANPTG